MALAAKADGPIFLRVSYTDRDGRKRQFTRSLNTNNWTQARRVRDTEFAPIILGMEKARAQCPVRPSAALLRTDVSPGQVGDLEILISRLPEAKVAHDPARGCGGRSFALRPGAGKSS